MSSWLLSGVQSMRARQGQRRLMARKRPLVHLSLSPDAITRLAEIATRCGETRSGVVEKLIREAKMPRPKTRLTQSHARSEESMQSLLRELRSRGWLVAVHNDYMQGGVFHTFWLFTKGSRCAKGESTDDEDALNKAFDEVQKIERETR